MKEVSLDIAKIQTALKDIVWDMKDGLKTPTGKYIANTLIDIAGSFGNTISTFELENDNKEG